jgi:hypothetical protein
MAREHDFHRIDRRDAQFGIFFDALAHVGRNELRDLNFVVQKCRHRLFRLAHDAVNDFVRRIRMLLCIRMIGAFLQ